jgi:hypothetical protein
LPFLVASVLVTVVLGADMALVTRQVLVGGTGLAQRTIFGNLTGLVVPRLLVQAGYESGRAAELAGNQVTAPRKQRSALARNQPPLTVTRETRPPFP